MNKIKKVISSNLPIVLLIIITTILSVNLIVKNMLRADVLPAAPIFSDSCDSLYLNLTKDVLLSKRIEFDTDGLNQVLQLIKNGINENCVKNNSGFAIAELFGDITGDKIIIYVRAKDKKTSYNLQIEIKPIFDKPNLKFEISKVKAGKINLPVWYALSRIKESDLPEYVTKDGKQFIYDTSGADKLMVESIRKDGAISSIESLLGIFLSINNNKFSLENIIDFSVNNVCISEDKLIVELDY